MRLKGHGLGSTRCCIFPPAIFYILSKVNEDGSYIVVYRSEASPGDSPTWLPVTISIRSLCNGDKDRGLQFHFFQEGFNGYHSSLGYILTSVNRMKSTPEGSHIKLIGKNGKVCWCVECAASRELIKFIRHEKILTFPIYIYDPEVSYSVPFPHFNLI